MPIIQTLSPHLADMIAAGEVVERPASVVKELLENAIDAGATAVTVELRGGGMELIRVSDNGCGIPSSELPSAFLRHATSKLRTEEDLSCIGTLGFRGEALAAISAVSRVEVASRRHDAAVGATLKLTASVPGETEECGCAEGTTISVSDLFYNTPARLKFMKKDSAEAAAATAAVQHEALSHPNISFKLIRDGREQLCTPGDGTLLSAIYAALGRDFALSLQSVSATDRDILVDGFVTQPLLGRGTRAMQHFFVNGRYVKSQLLTAALEEAYRNRMMKGKFPGCVLQIALPLTDVDVNVHPAKTVVKFLRERAAFDAVYYAVKSALDQDGAPPAAQSEPHAAAPRRDDFYRTMTAEEYRKKTGGGQKPLTAAPRQNAPALKNYSSELGALTSVADAVRPAPYTISPPPPTKTVAHAPSPAPAEPTAPATPARATVPAAADDTPQQSIAPAAVTPWRIAGEVLKTYIIAEDGETVWLIDKHAAHERVHFDRMKARSEPVMGQQLLTPETVTLEAAACAVLLEHLDLVNRFGFEAEDFGSNTLLCRACPSEIDVGDIAPALEEIADELLKTGRADPDAARDAMLHTMACKAAIKAGMTSDEKELRVLVDKVQAGEIRFCPHGRPVAVKLSKYQLEKMFKRA